MSSAVLVLRLPACCVCVYLLPLVLPPLLQIVDMQLPPGQRILGAALVQAQAAGVAAGATAADAEEEDEEVCQMGCSVGAIEEGQGSAASVCLLLLTAEQLICYRLKQQ